MKRWWMAVLAAALFSGTAFGQCGMRPCAVFGGSLNPAGVTARGDLVVANRDVVELYDASGGVLTRLDRLDPGNGPAPWLAITTVVVSGDVVGLTLGDRVQLVDASTGRLIPRASYTPAPGGWVGRVQGSAGMLYVESGTPQSTVSYDAVDVHDPSNPVRLGRASLPWGSLGAVGAGPWLYAAQSDRSLICVDLSDPASPRTAAVSLGTTVSRFDAIEDGRLWITSANGTSLVYDVSTPAAPVLLGASPITATGLTRVGSVWILGGVGEMRAIDLSDIAHPIVLGTGPGWAQGSFVGLAGGRVAAAGYAFGVVDVSEPAAMTTMSRVEAPVGVAQAVAAEESVLYVLQSEPSRTLLVFDASDLANPRLLGSVPVQYRVNAVTTFMAAADGVVLVLTREGLQSKLQIIDASDPAHPITRGSLMANAQPQGISVDGRLAVLAWSDSTMALLDLTDLDRPRVVSTVPVSNGLAGAGGMCSLDSGVLVVGSRLAGGFDVYDVSDPVWPRLLCRSGNSPTNSVAAFAGKVVSTEGGARGWSIDSPQGEASLTFWMGYSNTRLERVVKGQTGMVSPLAFFATDLPGGPYLRDWLAADLSMGGRAAPTSGAEVPGGLVSAGPTGPVWISPFGAPEAPVIRSGFLNRLRAAPPCIGEPYDLTVEAFATTGELAYQWYDRLDHAVEGATGSTLHIPRVTMAIDPGAWYCTVTNACGSTDYPARGGDWSSSWRFCAGDFNCDEFVDFFDYAGYLASFEGGDLRADVNGDDFLDFFDYAEFVRVFEEGC